MPRVIRPAAYPRAAWPVKLVLGLVAAAWWGSDQIPWRSLPGIASGLAALGGELPVPPTEGRVLDGAGVLSADQVQGLNELIAGLDRDTSAEIAVVTVSSLGFASVEDHATRLFKKWGIGKKGKDNGVLLLVAPKDHKVRIEVGYGLEGVLPDGKCGEVIRQVLVPAFKRGEYGEGILAATRHLSSIIRGDHETTAPPDTVSRSVSPESQANESHLDHIPGPLEMLLLAIFIGLFVAIGMFMLGAGAASRTGFPMFFGAFFGGMPFAFFSLPLALMPGGWIVALAHAFLGLALLNWGWRTGRAHPSYFASTRDSSGWTWGGGGGGGFGGGGGGGGFGGGGGGGGGASGSW